ncbi:glycine--tRNA ligase subunit beta [Sphingobium sp. GW456-12-10-14-TSB1]|uniref:Glycine--tRNA ligase beta subunit n=2 Tax=Sphingobium xenophagum TaxID=121428 RepID=A0A249MV38_SPHXE|nr:MULTISPECIES: glycine--tRNA ligase subunit beta [Sphingobium]ASY45188.1 glycine--tRNA ligase subunit beta [Sphingobium xenophagum]OUC54598.1 glycine--tRNA ligase subunit beta [Sphingobium sp. GW456-12-10-14-TSB1]QWT14201.1 glycine--tRNA ligase subunit beta [Sphingobium xenophagum]|tara:strand:- start:634 stop:2883 length:2250 start_codon:yes stop_codon:yes gene_type:complete
MTDFLLELRCEEIPARMQLKASDDLARLFSEELAKSGLTPGAIDSFVTPRRLALIARDLPLETAAVSEEHKGPRTSAPPQALEGFLRKTGLTQDQLEDRDGVWFAVINKPGRATADVLAQAIPAIIRAFPWPKSMRWGSASQTTESLRWVRPLQAIVAILGEDLIPCEVDGIQSGYATLGHRFHHSGEITIGGASDYAEKLRACHVIVSHQERQSIIAEKSAQAAAAHGYTVVEDKGLIAENAGLTEWPVPLLGDFDPAFLEVPPEVIQLTLRINQKYFVLRDGQGKLAPAFICTANIEAKDGGAAIIAGNRKVLAARLSDARFFWEQDRKTRLEDHAKKLERITFHEKLGTVADKVERVANLARWLVEEGIVTPTTPATTVTPAKAGVSGGSTPTPEMPASTGMTKEQLAQLAYDAAMLCKADLVTEMVGEFPELQGIMGGYYARAEGLPDAVADAIRDHYKPVGQGDDVPTAPVTVAVSLADKLDTIGSFFAIGERPTGSKDPFALRRAALGLISSAVENNVRFPLEKLFIAALAEKQRTADGDPEAVFHLFDFFIERLKVQQRTAGVRHDLIEAVFMAEEETEVLRLLARVHALQSFVATDDGANLLAGYKRAANILKKEAPAQPTTVIPAKAGTHLPTEQSDTAAAMDSRLRGNDGPLSYTPEIAEAALIAALDVAEPRTAQAVAAEDFEGAMAALATLRAPIDAFFESVTVNDPDADKRAARLALLARVRDAVHSVADFSKITG